MLCRAVQLEAELKDLEQQSSELQVEGQHAIAEYKVRRCHCAPALHRLGTAAGQRQSTVHAWRVRGTSPS